MKTVFVNPEHCIGCRQCEYACAVEHSTSRDPVLASWEEPLPVPRIHVEAGRRQCSSWPSKCRHCDPAPCTEACPTGAAFRDPEHDLVLVDGDRCIGCAMCAMVCPFDVVTFHVQAGVFPARSVATKCDGCLDRVTAGDEPACVEACKSGALVFGDLNELVARGRAHKSVALLSTLAGTDSNRPPAPATVASWRSWGAEATSLAEGASDDHAPIR